MTYFPPQICRLLLDAQCDVNLALPDFRRGARVRALQTILCHAIMCVAALRPSSAQHGRVVCDNLCRFDVIDVMSCGAMCCDVLRCGATERSAAQSSAGPVHCSHAGRRGGSSPGRSGLREDSSTGYGLRFSAAFPHLPAGGDPKREVVRLA